MRQLLFILMLLCAWQNVSAQKIKFTDSTNRWTQRWSNWNFQQGIIGTAQYNGTTLFDVLGSSHSNYLVREDTTLNKVFVRYAVGSLDTGEHILYDYNLVVGDTLMNWKVTSIGVDTFKHIVKSIDILTVNSIAHRMWTYEKVYATTSELYPPYKVIEGIGCLKGLDFPLSPTVFESSTSLICFANKGNIVTVIDSSGAEILGPKRCLSSVNNSFVKNKEVIVYPNPANENSVIRLPYKIASGILIITNTYGQIIFTQQFENKQELQLIQQLNSGFYFYRVVDKQSNQSFSGKFIYQ